LLSSIAKAKSSFADSFYPQSRGICEFNLVFWGAAKGGKKGWNEGVSPITISPEGLEKDMSPEHIAVMIAAPIIALIIVGLPLLDFIGPPCVRFLQRRRNPERSGKATLPSDSGTLAE
jgi:hypothetical protein